METTEPATSIERVDQNTEELQTSEGEGQIKRVADAPAVTTSTNPTDPRVLQAITQQPTEHQD